MVGLGVTAEKRSHLEDIEIKSEKEEPSDVKIKVMIYTFSCITLLFLIA